MIAKGRMPVYLSGPLNVIDVRDVAVAMMRAAERGRLGERYIVGHWNTSHLELYLLMADILGFLLRGWRCHFGWRERELRLENGWLVYVENRQNFLRCSWK